MKVKFFILMDLNAETFLFGRYSIIIRYLDQPREEKKGMGNKYYEFAQEIIQYDTLEYYGKENEGDKVKIDRFGNEAEEAKNKIKQINSRIITAQNTQFLTKNNIHMPSLSYSNKKMIKQSKVGQI